MKLKACDVQIKAGPDDSLDEGVFTAYASTWTRTPDAYGDVVAEGAFSETLAEWEKSPNTLPLLFGHRMDDPDFNIGGIVEATEDAHGLFVRAQLDLENPKAAQVYRLLKGRRISQMSFAYDVLDGDYVNEPDGEKFEIRKVRLYEVSVVPIGANQDTEILTVKALADQAVAEVKAGRVLAQKHIDSLRAAQEAIGTVIAAAEGTDDQDSKASGHAPAKPEEPMGVKGEERVFNPSVAGLALETQLLALT